MLFNYVNSLCTFIVARVNSIPHRRTGLEIFGGASRGSEGHAPRKILKNRVSLMPFPAFWCGFLCMEQTNKKKILRILVKQNEQEDCPTVK